MIGPNDLIALVSFDGRVYENQAVTREHLDRPQPGPHALSAALQHWLLRRHRMWLEVSDRHIDGIATAHDLASSRAWEIDTLLDASEEAAEDTESDTKREQPGTGVVNELLAQILEAALEDKATHVLLRLAEDAPALAAAAAAGFARAGTEQVWSGSCATASSDATHGLEIRRAEDGDAHGEFQLYNRVAPIEARRAIALTFEEWAATREERWLRRDRRAFVAIRDGQLVGSLRLAHTEPSEGLTQFQLLVADDAPDAATALLDEVAVLAEGETALTLLPEGSGVLPSLLRERGFAPGRTYLRLCRRLQRMVGAPERARARSGAPMPSGS